MEKYGVDEEKVEDKTAEDKSLCPTCGGKLRDAADTGVLICLKCGTAPFEKQ